MGAIVVIDPGVTCGLAWIAEPCEEERLQVLLRSEGLRGDVMELKVQEPREWQDEVRTADAIVDVMEAVETLHGLDTIIIEGFSLLRFRMDKDLLAPVRMTSCIMTSLYQRWETVPEAVFPPSSVLGAMTKERMQALNLWKGWKKDGRAAVRHLVAHLRKRPAH